MQDKISRSSKQIEQRSPSLLLDDDKEPKRKEIEKMKMYNKLKFNFIRKLLIPLLKIISFK